MCARAFARSPLSSAMSRMLPQGCDQLDKYHVIDLVGEGSFGKVCALLRVAREWFFVQCARMVVCLR